MSRFRCNTCRGEYDDVGADGVPYFHTCPPVVVVLIKDDAARVREKPLRALEGIQLVESSTARDAAIAAGADPAKVWVEISRREAPRKDARDETTLRREGARGEVRVIKAEGRGRTEIAAPATNQEPVDDAP